MRLHAGWWLPDDDEHFATFPIDLSLYQQPALDAALRWVPQDRRRLAVDVGAHVGLWAARLAVLFEHVVALEPDPRNRDCLVRNLAERRITNVEVVGAAAGSVQAIGHLRRLSPGNSGDVAVVPGPGPGPAVAVYPLDELLGGRDAVDMIKLDLQGFECEAVMGARAILRRHRPVVVAEFSKKLGPDKRVIELLAACGLHPVERIRGDLIYAPDQQKEAAA